MTMKAKSKSDRIIDVLVVIGLISLAALMIITHYVIITDYGNQDALKKIVVAFALLLTDSVLLAMFIMIISNKEKPRRTSAKRLKKR